MLMAGIDRPVLRLRYLSARGDAFRRGQPLPAPYRHPQYAVADHRPWGLPRPPRHQRWVQLGPDFVLVAARNGLITQVVLGH